MALLKASILPTFRVELTAEAQQVFTGWAIMPKLYWVGVFVYDIGDSDAVVIGTSDSQYRTLYEEQYQEFDAPLCYYLDASELYARCENGTTATIEICGVVLE